MKLSKPTYYDRFRCIAGSCPDSCCKEWDVDVDDASAARYRALSGPLGDRLRQVLKDEDGQTVMIQSNGRCPMWREDGLCRIQAELGEEALCQVCTNFPRLKHDYGDFVELGLELSCPEAARLILTSTPQPDISMEASGGEAPDYDEAAMGILLDSRDEILELLYRKDMPIGEALAVMLLYGYAVQNELDGGDPADLSPIETLAKARSIARPGNMEPILRFYSELEILTPQWQQRLSTPEPGPWQEFHRAMAVYFVKRYWLQAVSDYDLVGRVKLIILSCLVVKALGGDGIQTAQLYSKEIENDPDNIDAILDGAYTSPALADIGLLGLLLDK